MSEPHVLIAEDDPSLQMVLAESFRSAGYRVTTASDGDEALECFFAEPPDAVVLDIGMPGRNGFEVCRELRAHPGGMNLPIVFLTARAADADRHWGLDAGADDYLTKPFDPTTLTPLISELIESHRRGEERNPLTKLPDLGTLARRAKEQAASGQPIEAVTIEFESESADTYRQKYGDMRFAAAIRTAAACLREAVAGARPAALLLGHAGDVSYSRFALVGPSRAVAQGASRARSLFQRQAPTLYDAPDRERGFVAARRSDGSTLQVAFLELHTEPVPLGALAGDGGKSGTASKAA